MSAPEIDELEAHFPEPVKPDVNAEMVERLKKNSIRIARLREAMRNVARLSSGELQEYALACLRQDDSDAFLTSYLAADVVPEDQPEDVFHSEDLDLDVDFEVLPRAQPVQEREAAVEAVADMFKGLELPSVPESFGALADMPEAAAQELASVASRLENSLEAEIRARLEGRR